MVLKRSIRFLLLLLFAIYVNAVSVYSQSCTTISNNYFACGVPTQEFMFMRANTVNGGSQMQANWCWAACVQMVLNYHGLVVNQLDVVNKIYGSSMIDRPASESQILTALNGWAPSVNGRYYEVKAYGGFTSPEELVRVLSAKWPLIVGLRNPNGGVSHACVLTGVYYSNVFNNFGQYVGVAIDKVVLQDPSPFNTPRQEMSWFEFQQRAFMGLKVWVVR